MYSSSGACTSAETCIYQPAVFHRPGSIATTTAGWQPIYTVHRILTSERVMAQRRAPRYQSGRSWIQGDLKRLRPDRVPGATGPPRRRGAGGVGGAQCRPPTVPLAFPSARKHDDTAGAQRDLLCLSPPSISTLPRPDHVRTLRLIIKSLLALPCHLNNTSASYQLLILLTTNGPATAVLQN